MVSKASSLNLPGPKKSHGTHNDLPAFSLFGSKQVSQNFV